MADHLAIEADGPGNHSIEFTKDIGLTSSSSDKSTQNERWATSTQVLDSSNTLAHAHNDFLEDYRSVNCSSKGESELSNLGYILQSSQKEGVTPNPDVKPSDSAGMSSDVSESNNDWIDFRYNRIVSDKTNVTESTTNNQRIASSDVPNAPISKSVEEIMSEYGTQPKMTNLNMPKTCRMSNTLMDSVLAARPMNISQNNETLDALSSEVDPIRRTGSSVDADSGDFMKAFMNKASLSNTVLDRSRTSLASHTHLPVTEDKDLISLTARDSEVDFKAANPSFRKETNEMTSDLPGLGFTFQKERERLLNIDTILRRTPYTYTSLSGTNDYQPWKSQYNYTSSFMSGFRSGLPSSGFSSTGLQTEKRAFSSTDYRFSNQDWKQSSPEMDYENIRRATSNPSYRSFGQYTSMAGTSRPMGMTQQPENYSTPKSYSSGKSAATKKYSKKIETPKTSQFSKPSKQDTRHTTRETVQNKRSTQFTPRGNRNMSKAFPERQGYKQKNNEMTTPKTKTLSYTYIRDDENENRCSDTNKDPGSGRCRSSKSSTYVEARKYNNLHNKGGAGKYEPYQPTFTQNPIPLQQAKSQLSSVDGSEVVDFMFDNRKADAAKEYYPNPMSWSSGVNAVSRQANGTHSMSNGPSSSLRSTPDHNAFRDLYANQAWTNQTQDSVSDDNDACSAESIKHTGKKQKGKPKKTRSSKGNKNVKQPPFR